MEFFKEHAVKDKTDTEIVKALAQRLDVSKRGIDSPLNG